MYDKYLQDPQSIEEEWSNFFQGFDFAKEVYTEEDVPQVFQKEFKVINLIDATEKVDIYLQKQILLEKEGNILLLWIIKILD